jgi:hypothetical protein
MLLGIKTERFDLLQSVLRVKIQNAEVPVYLYGDNRRGVGGLLTFGWFAVRERFFVPLGG